MGNSVGYWQSCTGCTEGEDGHVDERYYPIHPKHGVNLSLIHISEPTRPY